MLIYPEALPDETLYSLLARIAVVNAMDDHLQVFGALVGQKAPASITKTSAGLDRFCELTQLAYGNLDDVLGRFTSLRLQAHLNVGSDQAGRIGIREDMWLNGGPYDYSGNPNREWRECPRCRWEDQRELGFSYWRRSHQLPTSYCCAEHGDVLVRKQLPGKRLHERFWLPFQLEDDPDPIDVPLTLEGAKVLSKIGGDALEDDDEPFHSDVIRLAFLDALKQRGCATRSGRIRQEVCLDSFMACLGDVHHSSCFEKEFKLALNSLAGSGGRISRQYCVILVYWLFGSWRRFKEDCRWQAVMGVMATRRDADAPGGRQSALAICHRNVCIEYMAENQQPSRGEFLRMHYRSFRWLLHHDPAWLEGQLPVAGKGSPQIKLFSD